MPRRPRKRRPKKRPEDRAKEGVVSARIVLELAHEWIVEPAKGVAFGELDKRVKGWYLNTQLKLLKGNRKDFHANNTQSRGIPDLFVRLRHWPRGAWIGVELKSEDPNAKKTDEQKYLEERNAIIITNNDEEVFRAIIEADEAFATITDERIEFTVPRG